MTVGQISFSIQDDNKEMIFSRGDQFTKDLRNVLDLLIEKNAEILGLEKAAEEQDE